MLKKRASAILTGTYIGKTYKEYRREFVDHFPYGKQIGKSLDQQKTGKHVPRPKNRFSWVWNLKDLKIRFHILKNENILNLLTTFLCIMGHTLFQTSSSGSELKQHRFGIKFRNTVNMQSKTKCGCDF